MLNIKSADCVDRKAALEILLHGARYETIPSKHFSDSTNLPLEKCDVLVFDASPRSCLHLPSLL
jgi:hypothetical protein